MDLIKIDFPSNTAMPKNLLCDFDGHTYIHQTFVPQYSKLKKIYLELATYLKNNIDVSIAVSFKDNRNHKHIYSETCHVKASDNQYSELDIDVQLEAGKTYLLSIIQVSGDRCAVKYTSSPGSKDRLSINESYFADAELVCGFGYEKLSNLGGTYGKIAVYTCIADGYDKLRPVLAPEPEIDYICFTNTEHGQSTGEWKIQPIPPLLNSISDSTKKARCIKVMPHLFLPDYDMSLWIDGNIQLIGKVASFIVENLTKNDFCIPRHPHRTCVYQEENATIELNKGNSDIIHGQIAKYRGENYPENYGMVQSGIIMRKHNEKTCRNIARQWWSEIFRHSRRDQLSFNYVCWKNPEFKAGILDPALIVSPYFQIYGHGDSNRPVRLPEGYGTMKNYFQGVEV